jgi:imidazoleglycerol-phosphate dehydratase/histidinol-phosphatase
MKKVLFIDRDGTLIVEPPIDFQVDSLEKLVFLPELFFYLGKIVREMDYELVMVTNQDGMGTDSFPENTFWPAQNKMMNALENEGIIFKDVCIDRSFEKDNSPLRKPNTGLLLRYMDGSYDLKNSFVIGDRVTDVKLAENLGTQSIALGIEAESATIETKGWKEIYEFLSSIGRKSATYRSTNETSIRIELNLDGSGKKSIDTGLPFFDHMLEQIAKHGEIDLSLSAKGDLEIDEHHTIEDIGLSLGLAFKNALGSKKGIERYAFLLPMDEALAQVAIDFGGRAQLVWNVPFHGEKTGDISNQLWEHFFKSFCDKAECNLNIQCSGDNDHHLIESIFKAFAKVLKSAVKQDDKYQIPSTKGVL